MTDIKKVGRLKLPRRNAVKQRSLSLKASFGRYLKIYFSFRSQ
jgi:hypothetical protein